MTNPNSWAEQVDQTWNAAPHDMVDSLDEDDAYEQSRADTDGFAQPAVE